MRSIPIAQVRMFIVVGIGLLLFVSLLPAGEREAAGEAKAVFAVA